MFNCANNSAQTIKHENYRSDVINQKKSGSGSGSGMNLSGQNIKSLNVFLHTNVTSLSIKSNYVTQFVTFKEVTCYICNSSQHLE